MRVAIPFAQLPSQAWDMSIGACAGAAAVMLSMPSDTIKTYLQTHTAGRLASSPISQVAQFFATGRSMVQQRGLQSLYLVRLFKNLWSQVLSVMPSL